MILQLVKHFIVLGLSFMRCQLTDLDRNYDYYQIAECNG
jgi:hypothetical protein